MNTIGQCWKEEPRWSSKHGQWKIQFPGGIGTFRTKREAMAWVDNLIKEGLATEDKAGFFANVRGRS